MRRRRLLHGLTSAILLVLIAVAPALSAQDAVRRSASASSAAVRSFDGSLAGVSAAVAERVPVPGGGPLHGMPAGGVAVLFAFTWIVLLLVLADPLGRASRLRRDRAPPRGELVTA